MRHLEALVAVPLLVVPLALWQCSGNEVSPSPSGDAGLEASTGDDDAELGDDSLGDDAGPTINCDLGASSGTPFDPVSLCFQKQVLEFVHESAVTTAGGVAASWDSTSLQPTSDGGTVLHDWRDDAAFGSAIADYLSYASKYGDNQIDYDVATALSKLAPVLEAELATLPDDYDGAPYMHLRNVVAGLNFVGDMTDASSIAAIADAYGNAIVATYLQPLGGGDMIVGRCSAPAVCTYETEKAATAALAILDLAWRSTFTDAGVPLDATAPPALTAAATAVLDHLALHARSPSGLYYRALVTSDAGDAGGGDGGPASGDMPIVLDTWPADALLSEVQATTMYALARAGTLVVAHTALSAAASFPFFANAESIYAGMHAAPSLWDTTLGGYYEAYVPSTGATYSDKPSVANALMYAAVAYDFVGNPPPANPDGGSLMQTDELATERQLLTQVGATSTSLITVISNQQAFFRASSAAFGLADAYGVDGGVTSMEPGASLYIAAATNAVLEGLSAQAIGVSDLQ